MQPLPDNTSALFTLSFHASSCTHVAQDVAYKRRRRISIRLLPHGLSACERSSHDARPHQVDLQTHTHVQAHTWKWSSLECVAPGPPGWKSHSSRALSPVRDKPGIPAGFADTAYHAAENNGAPAVQLHGATALAVFYCSHLKINPLKTQLSVGLYAILPKTVVSFCKTIGFPILLLEFVQLPDCCRVCSPIGCCPCHPAAKCA